MATPPLGLSGVPSETLRPCIPAWPLQRTTPSSCCKNQEGRQTFIRYCCPLEEEVVSFVTPARFRSGGTSLRRPHTVGGTSSSRQQQHPGLGGWGGSRVVAVSFYSLSMLCTHTHTRTHCGLHSMQQLVLQQPLLRSLLFWRWSCELGSGRFSRGTRCITVVLPRGSCSAPRVTLPCRKRPW